MIEIINKDEENNRNGINAEKQIFLFKKDEEPSNSGIKIQSKEFHVVFHQDFSWEKKNNLAIIPKDNNWMGISVNSPKDERNFVFINLSDNELREIRDGLNSLNL